MTTRSRQAWSTAVGFGLAVVVAISPLVGVLRADAAEGGVVTAVSSPGLAAALPGDSDSVYIDDSLQTGNLTDHWDLKGDRWTPKLMTIAQTNQIERSSQTYDCWGMLVGSNQKCQAANEVSYDGNWLTLTSDNTQNGLGESGFVLNKNVFASDLGVVVEYDQRVFRANNGNRPLPYANNPIQYGGDGISMFFVDANPSNFGESAVRTVLGDPGGYGAGLGYSSVSSTGAAWCPAQQGIAGAYLGIGFDVYGNFQKAEEGTVGPANPATRPNSVSGSNNFPTLGLGLNKRVPQSIGLRGSGVRFTNTPNCSGSDLERAYGLLRVPEVNNTGYMTFYTQIWDAGTSASDYEFQYRGSNVGWQPYAPMESSTRPGNTAGYMQARVPVTAGTSVEIGIRIKSNHTRYSPTAGLSQDSIITGATFQVLGTPTGGYRWLNGTPAHGYSSNAAGWIDNAIADATEYRRVRITITPKGAAREVVVSWSNKLDMTGDICVNPGDKLPTVPALTGAACSGTNGEWRYGTPVTFTEQFRYELTGSSYQAPLPAEFRLGFAASTGWAVNFHQIRNLRVTTVADLGIEKKIEDAGAWAGTHTARVGETVRYQLSVRNYGLDDLVPTYPSRITDGLTGMPLSGVTWTATATDGAQVRTGGGAWATTVSGTGPITGTALEWYGPKATTATAPQVTVVITGTVTTPTAYDTNIPNTATVATSTIGGPQDENPANNTSTANLKVVRTPVWNIVKASNPVTGTVVNPGGTITYTVSTTGDTLTPIAGVVLTDNLSDVLDDADFVLGSAKLKIGTAAETAVSDPVSPATNLVTQAFTLPVNTTATLTYQVTVKGSAYGKTLKNVVTGTSTTTPPATCANPATAGSTTGCFTAHTTPSPVNFFIQKNDTDGGGLDGAEFQVLTDISGAPGVAVPGVTLTPVVGTPGRVTIQGLGNGTYWLVETKAPAGHVLLAQPVKFTVAAGAITLATPNTAVTVTADKLTITVVDQPAYVLPLTGGHGNGPFILGGIVLIAIAAGLWGGAELRRRRLRRGATSGAVDEGS